MLPPTIIPTDHLVSDRTGTESLRANRPRDERPNGKGGFSFVLESMTQPRARSSSHSPSAPRQDRQAHEPHRSGSPHRPSPAGASHRSRSAGALRSPEPQEASATSPKPEHPGSETEQARAQGMNETDEKAHTAHDHMTEHDRMTEADQLPERDGTAETQMPDVTIALSVCPMEPVVAPVEMQPVQLTAGAMTEEAAHRAPPTAPTTMDPKAQQAPIVAGEGNDGKAASGDGKSGTIVTGLVPGGDRAIPATMSDTQAAADVATLTSFPPSDGKAGTPNAPARVSAGSSLPIETQASQNLRGGSEGWQQGDHAVADVMVENRVSSEWVQSGSAQDQATGERGDRPARGSADSSGPGHVQLHGESGFGETVAAMAADKSPSADGGASRTSASSLTGRAAAPSWATGDEPVPMMQAVSLNLEPADLGPINVRIFMMDRTVHTHIRTDQMELGQGMLSQQQQLETRLQNSGLEMGEFKVTVDQHQLSRGDSQGWLRHQGDGRPSPADPHHRAPEGDARELLGGERQRWSGIVSLFA